MKSTSLTFLAVTVLHFILSAQFPTTFQYQAVLRHDNGSIMANQAVVLRFTIHGGSAMGPVRYQETRNTTTNEFGLVNTTILNGTVVIPGNIFWTSESNFLQVEVNASGSFIDLGTQQILAVPYAINASNAQTATQVAGMELENQQHGDVITWDGNQEMWIDKKIPSFWPTETQQYLTIPGRGIWHNTTGIAEDAFSFFNESPPATAVVEVSATTNIAYANLECSVPDADCVLDPKLTPLQFPPNAMITSFTLHGSGTVKAKLYRQHLSNPAQIELIAEDMPESVTPFDDHLVNNVSFSYYLVVEPIFTAQSTDIGIVYQSNFSLNALQIGYSLPNE